MTQRIQVVRKGYPFNGDLKLDFAGGSSVTIKLQAGCATVSDSDAESIRAEYPDVFSIEPIEEAKITPRALRVGEMLQPGEMLEGTVDIPDTEAVTFVEEYGTRVKLGPDTKAEPVVKRDLSGRKKKSSAVKARKSKGKRSRKG